MPTAPSDPNPAVAAAPSPEESFKQAWDRHGGLVYILCGIVLLGIIARGGWQYLSTQRELEARREFGACTTADSFRAFAADHPGHPLAGLAEVHLADDAFAAGRYAEAQASYDQAVPLLSSGPVRSRARMGSGVSLALEGKTADAQKALGAIVDDESELKPIRCEAAYHLAVIAASQGRPNDIKSLAERALRIDPSSRFAERAMELESEAPVPGSGAPAVAVPAVR